MVEAYASESNAFNFSVKTRTIRAATGRRTIEVIEDLSAALPVADGENQLRQLTSEDIARKLGVSERHCRRIKQGDITKTGLGRHFDVLSQHPLMRTQLDTSKYMTRTAS